LETIDLKVIQTPKVVSINRKSASINAKTLPYHFQSKYLGVCKLPKPGALHRRLDIIVVPFRERAPALLYFTGSAHFNRSMRLLASKLGMSLSEHALRSGVVRKGREKLNDGHAIATPTEESIFEKLGLPYRAPNERDH
jgi:DNA polymerase lambda